MHVRGQEGDVAGHFAKTEVLNKHFSELLQRKLLVGAVHRGTRVNDVAQRTVVILIDCRMLDEHLDDGGHGEQVCHAMLLDQLPEGLGVKLLAWQQDRCRAACHVEQRMDSCAVRQRGNDNRSVGFVGARNQVRQMVVDDKRHLVVRQDSGLGLARGARGVKEPERVTGLDGFRAGWRACVPRNQVLIAVLAVTRRTDCDDVTQIAGFRANGVGMLAEEILDDHCDRVA